MIQHANHLSTLVCQVSGIICQIVTLDKLKTGVGINKWVLNFLAVYLAYNNCLISAIICVSSGIQQILKPNCLVYIKV
jgi:hypothetical protein